MPKNTNERGISRREFSKAAVAIGGSAALSACLDRGGDEGSLDLPTGPEDPSTLPERHTSGTTFWHRTNTATTSSLPTTSCCWSTTPTRGRPRPANASRSSRRCPASNGRSSTGTMACC